MQIFEDFKFNKNFGQNFISDKNLLNAIVSDSGISSCCDVLEIGTGAGTLTEAIADKALERKTGARGLRAIMENVMLDLMYTIPSADDISECVITKDMVEELL